MGLYRVADIAEKYGIHRKREVAGFCKTRASARDSGLMFTRRKAGERRAQVAAFIDKPCEDLGNGEIGERSLCNRARMVRRSSSLN